MVRDEVLRAPADPGQVTHAQLATVAQRDGETEASWVGERSSAGGGSLRGTRRQAPPTQSLRLRKVEAEDITAFFGHANNLTVVDSFCGVTGRRFYPGPVGLRELDRA